MGNLSNILKMGFVYESVQPPIASTVMDRREWDTFLKASTNSQFARDILQENLEIVLKMASQFQLICLPGMSTRE